MSDDNTQQEQMFDRDFKTSLYNCGYTDGYDGKGYNPRWIPQGLQESGASYVIDEEEVAEYDQGYKDGKFHSAIDKKQ